MVRHLIPNLGVDRLKRRYDVLRQRALLNRVEVGLQLLHAAGTHDDRVAVLGAQNAVVRRPAERRGMAADAVPGSHHDRPVGGRRDGGRDVQLPVHVAHKVL